MKYFYLSPDADIRFDDINSTSTSTINYDDMVYALKRIEVQTSSYRLMTNMARLLGEYRKTGEIPSSLLNTPAVAAKLQEITFRITQHPDISVDSFLVLAQTAIFLTIMEEMPDILDDMAQLCFSNLGPKGIEKENNSEKDLELKINALRNEDYEYWWDFIDDESLGVWSDLSNIFPIEVFEFETNKHHRAEADAEELIRQLTSGETQLKNAYDPDVLWEIAASLPMPPTSKGTGSLNHFINPLLNSYLNDYPRKRDDFKYMS